MQKFVCRQATDVSRLLPLPIPSNTRQERNLAAMLQQQQQQGRGGLSRDPDSRFDQCKAVLSTLGRVHGILFSVKQTSPALYAEFVSTLGLEGDRGRMAAVTKGPKGEEVEAAEEAVVAAAARAADAVGEEAAKIRRQINSLGSPHSALPFSIINHGNLR